MSTPSTDFVELTPSDANALANYLGTRPIGEAMQHFNVLAAGLQVHKRAGEAALVRNAEIRGEIRGEKVGERRGRDEAAALLANPADGGHRVLAGGGGPLPDEKEKHDD